MPRKSLMQDVIIYTYYVDYTMKLTSKRFDRCIEYRFSFLKERKKYYLSNYMYSGTHNFWNIHTMETVVFLYVLK